MRLYQPPSLQQPLEGSTERPVRDLHADRLRDLALAHRLAVILERLEHTVIPLGFRRQAGSRMRVRRVIRLDALPNETVARCVPMRSLTITQRVVCTCATPSLVLGNSSSIGNLCVVRPSSRSVSTSGPVARIVMCESA